MCILLSHLSLFFPCLSNGHNNAPLNLSTVRIHYIRYGWEYTKLAISDNYQSPNMVSWDSLIAQLVKNSPAMQETPVWFLGLEDPLEKG